MPRHETDREDLMREAVAMVRRVELKIPGQSDSIICGFRSNGWLSLYFGPDPVYHFDAEDRLRRAFVGDLLYRTQGTTLAQLKRERSGSVTELRRHDLTPDELNEFLETARTRLKEFLTGLESDAATVAAQVPPEDSIVPELIDAVRRVLRGNVQLAPAIKGKR